MLQPRATSQKIEFSVGTKEIDFRSRAFGIVEYYKEHTPYTFGEALCKCMESGQITVMTLSERTGISERQIGRLRNNEVKEIGFRTIIALCVALGLVLETAEKLLNLKRYTLQCDDPYVQICKMFLQINISVSVCNDLLQSLGFEPLTDGEIWS